MTRIDQQVEALDRIFLLTTILDADMTRGLDEGRPLPVTGRARVAAAPARPEHPARARRGARRQRPQRDRARRRTRRDRLRHGAARIRPTAARRWSRSPRRAVGSPTVCTPAATSSPGSCSRTMPQRTFTGLVDRPRLRAGHDRRAPRGGAAMRWIWGWVLFAWRFEVNLYKSLFRFVTRRPRRARGRHGGEVRRRGQRPALGVRHRLGRRAGRAPRDPAAGRRCGWPPTSSASGA